MSDNNFDKDDDLHTRLILAYMEYFRWNDRFKKRNSFESGVNARNALRNIMELAKLRRKEIMAITKAKEGRYKKHRQNIQNQNQGTESVDDDN